MGRSHAGYFFKSDIKCRFGVVAHYFSNFNNSQIVLFRVGEKDLCLLNPVSGDKIIKVISKIMKGNIRLIDLGCRSGREKFVVILPEMRRHEDKGEGYVFNQHIKETAEVAERIRKKIQENKFEFLLCIHALLLSTKFSNRTIPNSTATSRMVSIKIFCRSLLQSM